jgi:predicted transcriptional regulator
MPAMLRTQVYLTEAQDRALKRLARTTGRSQSQLIRDAVDRLIEAQPAPASDWKEAFRRARGMWADRAELDQLLGELRREGDQRIARSWRRS